MPKGVQGFQKGHTVNVGRRRSTETRERISKSKMGAKNPMFGATPWNKDKKHLSHSDNPAWKGDNVGYHGLHVYMRRHLAMPESCNRCGSSKPLELSNNGVYDRDFSNWEWICNSYHAVKDERHLNFGMTGKRHTPESKEKMRQAWVRRKALSKPKK